MTNNSSESIKKLDTESDDDTTQVRTSHIESLQNRISELEPLAELAKKRHWLDYRIEVCIKSIMALCIVLLIISFTVFIFKYLYYLWYGSNDPNMNKIEYVMLLVMQTVFAGGISIFLSKYLRTNKGGD